jgi:LSD1 subclass zinc finger protein
MRIARVSGWDGGSLEMGGREGGDISEFVVDRTNLIIEVEVKWDVFGGGAFSPAARLIGTVLEDHISGEETRSFVTTLLSKARSSNVTARYRYRCDAPEAKRFCEMELRPEHLGRVRMLHRLVRSEPLPTRLKFESGRASESVRCSICNRVRHHGKWREAEQALSSGLFKVQAINYVIYKVCDDCRDETMTLHIHREP